MARNSSFNSLARKSLRRARTIKVGKNGQFSIPLIIVPGNVSSEMLVSSIFKLANFSAYQKKILQARKALQKRIIKLQAEGYTFSDSLMELAFGDTITFSKKTLNRINYVNSMNYLRTHATSLNGNTDIIEIIAEHNRQVSQKRAEARRTKELQDQAENGQLSFENMPVEKEVENELDAFKEFLEEEIQKYIAECDYYIGAKSGVDFVRASDRARAALQTVRNASEYELEQYKYMFESGNTLEETIALANRRFEGLFYQGYAPTWLENLMDLAEQGDQARFEWLFQNDVNSSSSKDFGDEYFNEDDFSDVPEAW